MFRIAAGRSGRFYFFFLTHLRRPLGRGFSGVVLPHSQGSPSAQGSQQKTTPPVS